MTATQKSTTPAELRTLLKSELGLNSQQVTVAKSHSNQYLEITVRDSRVHLPTVEKFAAKYNTWSMDVTDYVTGQSVTVKTTDEVDDAHAAPWMETILGLLPHIENCERFDSWLALDEIKPGMQMQFDQCEVWLTLGRERRCYRRRSAVLSRESWAIRALALDIARLLENQPAELPEWMDEIDESAPLETEVEPEPENIVPFALAATPEPAPAVVPVWIKEAIEAGDMAPGSTASNWQSTFSRPAEKPRHYTQQAMCFAETDLFTLR
jgi:hypothetical protein